MIKKIKLVNFKAFAKADIQLKPITVFLGPNNSGKSSIMAALRMLSQTIESYDQNVPLLLNGPMGDFGTYRDVVYSNHIRRHFSISVTFDSLIHPQRYYNSNINEKSNTDRPSNEIELLLKYKYRSSIRQIILNELTISENCKEIFYSKYSEDSEKHIIQRVNQLEIPQAHRSFFSRRYRLFHFLPRSVFIQSDEEEDSSKNQLIEKTRSILRNLPRKLDYLYFILGTMEYIGAMRLPPSRTYMFSGERNAKVGPNGENAPNILMMDSMRKGTKRKNIKDNIIKWLNNAGLASDIKVVTLSDRHYELHIQNSVTKEYQNFSDVGYGNSQIIPILVAGFNLNEKSLLMVEEPEIHLHPKAQAELGDFILSLYNENKQTIVETHSEHLIVRLQQHVAEGLISPSDIALYYIYPNDGIKEIKTIQMDDNGIFTEEWPQGFFPERLSEAKKLARLRYNKSNPNKQ